MTKTKISIEIKLVAILIPSVYSSCNYRAITAFIFSEVSVENHFSVLKLSSGLLLSFWRKPT